MDDVPMSPDLWPDEPDTEQFGDVTVDDDDECSLDDDCSNLIFKTPLTAAQKRSTARNSSFNLSNTKPRISQIPESLFPIVDHHNISWTSSLATPSGDVANSSWTHFNTEERKVLLPCRDEAPTRRILFTSDDLKNSNRTPKSPVWSKHEILTKLMQSTPKVAATNSDTSSTKPTVTQLSPIFVCQEQNVDQTPLSSSARFARNRRWSDDCRTSLALNHQPLALQESSEEEQSSPSILAGHKIVTFSPPKSPIIGTRVTTRKKNKNSRLSLKSQASALQKRRWAENIECETKSSTNLTENASCSNKELPPIIESFSINQVDESIKFLEKCQVPLSNEKAPSNAKSQREGTSNNRNDEPLVSSRANPRSTRSKSLSGKCSWVDHGGDSVPSSSACSPHKHGCNLLEDEMVDTEITSSPIISCNQIMKTRRKRTRSSLSSSCYGKKEPSIFASPKDSKNNVSSQDTGSSSTTTISKKAFDAMPTPISKHSSPMTDTIKRLSPRKESCKILRLSTGSCQNDPFGFSSQNDLSSNMMQEICKVSDFIESTADKEKKLPSAHDTSKKLKFVSAKKKDDQKSRTDGEPKSVEARVRHIKTRMDAAKSRNLLYPNVGAHIRKDSSDKVDINQLVEYARLLEVVANLDCKLSSDKSMASNRPTNGFVQFSKMKQEASSRELARISLHGTNKHRDVNENSSNCDLKDFRQKREAVQTPSKTLEKECIEITSTQMTRLVKDAVKMFETEDSQWGYKVPNLKDSRTLVEDPCRIDSDFKDKPNKQSKKITNFQNSASSKCKDVESSNDTRESKILDDQPLVESASLKLDINAVPAASEKSLGFASASGKKLNVSESALNNSIPLFSDNAFILDRIDTPKGNASKSMGFSTASGKKMSISKVAMNNARKLFEDVDSPIGNGEIEHTTPKGSFNIPLEFNSASGKKSALSDVAVTNPRKLLNDAGGADCDTPQLNLNAPEGFTSASGKKITISEASVKKARTLFAEVDSSLTQKADVVTPKLNNKITVGFSSVSGKKLNISEASLKKARTLFDDIDSTFKENADVDTPNQKKNIPVGFSSASGKKMSISDASIKKARTLFDDVELSFKENSDIDTPNQIKTIPMGFSSASGKKFNISEASIKKARTLFDEIESTCVENASVETPKLNNKMPFGFSSASGKKFSVSDASIKKARTLFSDVDTCTSNVSDLERPRTPENHNQPTELHSNRPKNSAFKKPTSTCTDISLTIMPDKSKSIQSAEGTSTQEPKPFGCFSAASGRKTTAVSESSLLKARNLFSQSTSMNDHDQNSSQSKNQRCPTFKKDYDCSIITPNIPQDDIDIEEVLQATEAFMADEESGVPLWITTFTSSPSVFNDRMDNSKPMVDGTVDKKSTILGQHDRFRPKKKKPAARFMTKRKLSEDMAVFKTPYKRNDPGATPVMNSINNKKRGADFEFGTPFAKRLAPEVATPADTLKQVELSTEEVGQLRLEAWKQQQKAVKTKDSLSCRPCQGSQLLRKQEQQVRWKQLTSGNPPGHFTRAQLIKLGVREAVINVTAENAGDFVFSAHDHYGPSVCSGNVYGLPVGDAALLVLDADGRANVDRVETAFLVSPGVDPKLVPPGWVRNHHRWLVWKLAATEKSFPHRFAARCLTPNLVLLQLKYRYDREIDRCERPAIRRILEQDDTSTRRLVLCVVRVIRVGGEHCGFELELTDGWYSVMASLDADLTRMVTKGSVVVGTKLITHGAELNSREACYPLEAKEDVRLKLSANSTRRAQWHTKLGFQANPGPLKMTLGALLPAGGLVGRIDVYVARVYPTLYIEMLGEGRKVTRSELAESRAAALFDRQRQDKVESVYAKVRAELHNDHQAASKTGIRSSSRNLASITSGSQLSRLLDQSPDPGSLQELLTSDQLAEVYKFRQQSSDSMMRQLEARVQQELADEGDKRNVSTLLKIRCMDVNGDTNHSAILSVWRAPEDLPGLLREGAIVSMFNVTTSGKRMGSLQLTAGRQTRYQTRILNPTGPDTLVRSVTGFRAAAAKGFQPLFSELDLVGIVVHVVEGTARLQTVYLADAEFDFIGIAFWTGLKEAGFDELLKPGVAISAANLQWRNGPVRHIAHVHAAEQSAFSRNPRQPHLRLAIETLCTESKHISDFMEKAVTKLLALLQDTKMPHILPQRMANPSTTQLPALCPATPQMPHSDPEQQSSAQQRIERLRCYSDPPALPPMAISSSQQISKEFRLPTRGVVDETNKRDEFDSPPLSLE